MSIYDRPSEWLRARRRFDAPDSPGIIDWAGRHNRAVEAYLAERGACRGAHSLTHHERAILSLADGIDQYIGNAPDQADPLSGEFVWQLVEGFRGLLNYELGRLHGGTLDTWAASVCERWGISPDTGEWVGGA